MYVIQVLNDLQLILAFQPRFYKAHISAYVCSDMLCYSNLEFYSVES
jgi:hypothetical protein